MENYNYKVIAELRDDLSEVEKKFISEKVDELMKKMGVENIGDNTFCKKSPIVGHNDFGPVCFFSIELEKYKEYFAKLEYFDIWEGERDIAV